MAGESGRFSCRGAAAAAVLAMSGTALLLLQAASEWREGKKHNIEDIWLRLKVSAETGTTPSSLPARPAEPAAPLSPMEATSGSPRVTSPGGPHEVPPLTPTPPPTPLVVHNTVPLPPPPQTPASPVAAQQENGGGQGAEAQSAGKPVPSAPPQPLPPLLYCKLSLCLLGGRDAPRLFVIEHGDGAGHRMKNILDGIATAAKNRMNFGGLMPVGNIVTEHGHNFRSIVDGFFGYGASSEFFVNHTPEFAAKFKSVRELELNRKDIMNGTNVYIPAANEWWYDHKVPASVYYPAVLRTALAQKLNLRPLVFKAGVPAVALHIRRGDLKRSHSRTIPDTYYYNMVELIRKYAPNSDVHVWSSLQSYSAEVEQNIQHWSSADFDGYRARGMTVHLDDQTLLDPWANLVRANILVMSTSAFSYVPAVMNMNCVIYPGNIARALDGWMNGKDKFSEKQLKACIERGTASVGQAADATQEGGQAGPAAQPSGAGPPSAAPLPSVDFAGLGAFSFHGQDAPRLFVKEPDDGAGHRMKNILDGMATAARSNMNFGGVVSAGSSVTEHGVDFRTLADSFFGKGASQELFVSKETKFSEEFATVVDLEKRRGSISGGASVYLPSPKDWHHDPKVATSQFYTKELLAALRRPLAAAPLRFEPNLPMVAVHVRRGDLKKGDPRATNPGYYFDLIERLRKFVQNADVHLWSTEEGTKADRDHHNRHWSDQDFNGFMLKGMKLHLDPDDIMDAWAHMSRAHVLVMSQSAFSYVPAVLNPNCVIWDGKADNKLDGWLDGKEELNRKPEKSLLKDCLARGLAHLTESGKFCNLAVCTFHKPDAPRLFVAEHGDGAGHRMKNILDGMAVARRNKMNFGGTVPVGNIVTEHGHNFRTLADGFFGPGATEALFIQPKPEFQFSFNSVPELEQRRDEMEPGSSVFLPSANEWTNNRKAEVSDYYSKELLALLRLPLASRPVGFAANRPSVAVHLRRGDLKRWDPRATKNEYYFEVLEHVKHHLPKADIHVWSSIQSYSAEVEQGKRHWNSSDFDGFRERGMTVHLDGESLLDPWVHMSRADVFVSSVSSFSYVPSVLNPHCIIFAGNLDRPFPGWVNGLEEIKRKPDNDAMQKCLARGK